MSFLLRPPPLAPGLYSIDAAVNDGTQREHRLCDWIVNAAIVELGCAEPFHGRIRFPVRTQHQVHGA